MCLPTLALLLLAASAQAQGGGALGAWTSYTGTLHPRGVPVALAVEGQIRTHRGTSDLDQALVRAGIQGHLPGQVTLTQGYAFVHAGPPGEGDDVTVECRLFQDASGTRRVGAVRVSPRIRFEERWVEGEPFQTRLRLQLGATVPVTGDAVRRGSVYTAGSAELFLRGPVRGDHPVYDRTRIYGGLGVRAADNLGVQAGLLAQVLDGSTDLQVQLSLHHALAF